MLLTTAITSASPPGLIKSIFVNTPLYNFYQSLLDAKINQKKTSKSYENVEHKYLYL